MTNRIRGPKTQSLVCAFPLCDLTHVRLGWLRWTWAPFTNRNLSHHLYYGMDMKLHTPEQWDIIIPRYTHGGRETHICVGNLTIIGSDNGLSPGWRQAIIGTNVVILLIGTLGTNFSEIWIEMYIFSFKKMHLKVSSGKWWQFCLGLDVLADLVLPV